jgi:hypothetical protein
MRRRGAVRSALMAGVFALALAVTPAAHADDDGPWADVPLITVEKPWKQWIAASLFIIGCAAIGFKNPHRTHLD